MDSASTPFQTNESDMNFTLPGNTKRMQDMNSYKELKGKNLSEMDFCWIEGENTLCFLEAKDLTKVQNELANKEERIEKLKKKFISSLFFFSSVWIKTKRGLEIIEKDRDSLSQFQKYPQKIKYYFVFKIKQDQIQLLQGYYDHFFNEIEGVALLFDMNKDSIKFLNEALARKKSWIS